MSSDTSAAASSASVQDAKQGYTVIEPAQYADSGDSEVATPEKTRIDIHVPTNLLVLPSVAGLVGFLIGMRRAGSKARLRFLAENAHRQPTTVQGWYFYTKTRNYRVFFASVKGGAKTGMALTLATALYVCVDEGAGWLRERLFDPERTHESARVPANPNREGWRKGPVHWEDGAVAGGVLAMGVGLAYRLPNPLMIRGMIMGVTLGSITSALQIAQDKVAQMRAQEEAQKAAVEAAEAARKAEEEKLSTGAIDGVVADSLSLTPVDELVTEQPSTPTEQRTGWFSWLGGK